MRRRYDDPYDVIVECGVCHDPIMLGECTCPPGAFDQDRDGNMTGPDESCPLHVMEEHEGCSHGVDDEIDRRMEA